MIWREKQALLIILGGLLLGNTLFFFTYRVQYQSRLDDLDRKMESAQGDLEQARHARVTAERTLQSYRQVENDVAEIFREHWATERERLTAMIVEVKRLSVASGLVPPTYSFAHAGVKRVAAGSRARKADVGANEVSIAFTVQGSYAQVRRLINLLELSRQFVIIEQIGLTSADERTLTLNLGLKTLFRDDTPAAASDRS
jgi:hypothetical protein